MPTRIVRHALAALLFAGCASSSDSVAAATAGLPAEIGTQVALGKNLTGDVCQLRTVSPGAFGDKALRHQIFCQGWEQPSGQLIRMPSGSRTAKYWLEESGWAQFFSADGNCGATEQQPLLQGSEVVMRRCANRAGVIRLLIVAKGDGVFYLADFLPTNAPLIERAVLASTGKRPLDAGPPEGTRMANIRAIEELVGKDGPLASVADYGLYRKLTELGEQQNFARQYRRSELTFRRALDVQERLVGPNNPGIVESLHWLAIDLNNERRSDAAGEILDRAEPLVKKSGEPSMVARQFYDRSYIAGARDPDAEMRFAQQAVDSVNPAVPGQKGAAAEANFALGQANTRRNMAAAEAPLRRSMEVYAQLKGTDYVWTNRARLLLARVLIAQKKLPEAKALLEQAEASADLLYGHTIWWANAKVIEAEYHMAAGDNAAALGAYRAYVAVAAREQFTCYFGRCTVSYIDLLLRMAAADPARREAFLAEAFAVGQATESTVTSSAITQLAARVAADDHGIEDVTRRQQDLREQEQRQRAELAGEIGKPAEKRNPAHEAELKQSIAAAAAGIEAQELELQSKFPRYAQLVGHKTVNVRDATALLKPGEGILLYADFGSKGFSFLLHDGKVEAKTAAIAGSDLVDRVVLLRAGLEAEGGGKLPPFDLAASYALFNDLFGSLLQQAPGLKRLVVVPSGALLSLPPEVLVTVPPQGAANYGAAAWLVRDYAVTVAPSVRAFAELRQAPVPPKYALGFYGLGNPTFTANAPKPDKATDDPCAERRNLRAVVARLPALPETADEVRALGKEAGTAGSKILLGKEATKAALAGPDLDKARVVAFATHGLLPSDLVCEAEPALALTPGPDNAPGDDGLLKASDITALRLDATLVILSACNTAGADGRLSGDSLSGLVRAFFFAGGRNVLATHWPIPSKPTVALTTGTIQAALKNGGDWAGGLREAQLKLLQDPATAHPLFWGAFVLVGSG